MFWPCSPGSAFRDSRYAVGEWIEQRAEPGDRGGYFGASQKLPPLPEGIISMSAQQLCTRSDWESPEAPEMVLVIPQQHFETDREWTLPPEVFGALEDGSLGYRLVLHHRTRPLFAERPVPFVNPTVRRYVQARHPAASGVDRPGDPPPAIAAGIEKWHGHGRWVPPGLERNPSIRTFQDSCPEGAFS